MRKLIGFIFALVTLAFVVSACGGDTYAKRVDREKKAIKKFLADNDIEVLKEYPVGKAFGPNEYYKDAKTGVFVHVIDSGHGKKAIKQTEVQSGTFVYMHFDSVRRLGDPDSIAWKTEGANSISLQYGLSNTYKSSQDIYSAIGLSPACVLPLEHIRQGAVVRLIVPFNYGSSLQDESYEPFYVGRLIYATFD